MEVVVVTHDSEGCFGYNDGSDSDIGLHGAAGAKADDDHIAFDDCAAFANEKVDNGKAHTNGDDGDGNAFERAR